MFVWLNTSVARWGVALAYSAGIIVYLLQQPGAPAVEVVAPVAAPDWQREIAFTVGHVVGFGVLFVLWWRALQQQARAVAYAAVITLAVGLTAELLQSQLPGRNASAYDMVMNTVGIVLAYAVVVRRTR